jgi:hypothetical protein
MLDPAATMTPKVLALAALLAVGTQTLCQGVDGHYGSTGAYRYPRLDKFLHDRMGLDNRSALTGDRSLLARTAISTTTTTTTVASVAAPEDEDYGGSDDEDDEEEDEEMTLESIRLRHLNHRENDNDLFDKVIILHVYMQIILL